MGIRLIADSCCDTGPQTDERLRDLSKAPLQVLVEEQAFVDDGTSHLEELIAAMKASRQAARSACPGPEDFACRIRGADDCLVITLSSKLSGSYNAARNARDLVLEDEPGKRIHILDSASASAGETRLALFAQACLDAGNDFDTAVRRAESFAAGMRTLFVLEDLSALVKSGRLNKVSGIVASILSLCPVLGADGHGEIKMVAKARGMQNALRRLTEIVGQETASLCDDGAGSLPGGGTGRIAENAAESLLPRHRQGADGSHRYPVHHVCGQRRYCGGLLMLFRGFSDNLHRFFRFACYSKSISMRRGG